MKYGQEDNADYDIDPSEIISPDDEVIFSTFDKDFGIVPEPRDSDKFMPKWADDASDEVREAMSLGWMIRTPTQVYFRVDDEGIVRSRHRFDRDAISKHSPRQAGDMPIPIEIIKFFSYWSLNVPDGYSVLFTHPLARQNNVFQSFSGVVDFDNFSTFSHAPALYLGDTDSEVEVPEGTPILQAIPFKRNKTPRTARVRPADDDELPN